MAIGAPDHIRPAWNQSNCFGCVRNGLVGPLVGAHGKHKGQSPQLILNAPNRFWDGLPKRVTLYHIPNSQPKLPVLASPTPRAPRFSQAAGVEIMPRGPVFFRFAWDPGRPPGRGCVRIWGKTRSQHPRMRLRSASGDASLLGSEQFAPKFRTHPLW